MQKKELDKWFVVGLAFALLVITAYVFLNTKYNAQSDWATAVLLAREQIRSGQWFPDSWVYAQSIWTFSLNLLVIPFWLITDNMLLAREFAVITQILFGIWLCYSAMKRIVNKNAALLVCVLLLVPLSTIVNRNFFYEATYFMRVIWLSLLIITGDNAHRNLNGNRKKALIWCVAWLAVCTAMSITDAKVLVMTIAPFLAALVVYLGIKEKVILRDMLRNYRAIILGGLMLVGVGCGMLINALLKTSVIFDNGVASLTFADSGQWGNNLIAIMGAFAELYGLDGDGSVVSLQGVISILKGAVALIFALGIPVTAVCLYAKLKNTYQKLYVLFSAFAAFFIIYICMISEGVGDIGRYFLGVYINNIVLAGICFDHLVGESKYYRRLILSGVMALSVLCAVQYRDYREIEYDDYQEMISFLKEQNISFGYAEYWSAGVTTVLSNGEVELVAHEGRQGTPYYWLSSTEWYEPDYHQGDFCMVVKEGGSIDERYREEADEIYHVACFEIWVFRRDRDELGKLFFAFPQKVGDSYTYYGDNFYFKTQCGSVEGDVLVSQSGGALLYGQYCVLAPGTYRIEVDMEVTGTSGCSVELLSGSTVFGSVWCGAGDGYVLDNVVVPERSDGSELRISVGGDAQVKVKSITITKTN